MFESCPLFFLLIICLLLGDASLDNSLIKPRSKRSLSWYRQFGRNSSLKDLALELAKKHLLKMIIDAENDLEKTRDSLCPQQRGRCSNIRAVGKPVTHHVRSKSTQGAWMKDPLGIMGSETIFVMESYTGKDVLEEFENMAKLKAGITRKTYKLPYQWDGTGGVVYGQYLYYNRANTNYIVKFNLRSGKEEAQIRISDYTPRKSTYGWGGYSGVDLAVDENGLWVLWGSTGNNYRLRASKINVQKNSITHTWSLNTEKMRSMGNAFVACGVVYCTDSYNSKSTTINFAYDTKTGKQWNPNIQFTNQYGYNSMVDYNSREKVLYAWDYTKLVTYSITFN